MHQMIRFMVAAMAVTFAGFWTSAPAQVAATQINLTEKQVEGFIAAQVGISTILEKTQGTVYSDDANSKYKGEVDAIARKHGFKNLAEYETVAANISMIMAAIDPQTKVFTDPQTAIRQEIEDVRSDKTISNSEKKQLLVELNEALKSAQPIQFPTNIELVKKYYDKIDVTDIAAYDNPSTSSVVRTISE